MPRNAAAAKNAAIQEALQGTLTPDLETNGPGDDGALDSLFAPLDDTTDTYNFCFWGAEGGGKTTALASAVAAAPEGSKVLIVNAEGGVKKKALQRRGIDTSKLVIYPNPETTEQITRAGLDRVYRRVASDLARDPNSWFAVGWDSATEVHEKIVNQVSDNRLARAKARIEKAGGEAEFDEYDEFFTDRDDYGTMSKMVKDLLRKFRDLNCHFIVTALERRDVDEKTSKVTYGPAVTPGLQNALLGYTDVNLYFKKADEDGPFRALVSGIASYRTKDRMGGLPKVLADPSFERILGYTNGDLEEATDELQKALPAIRQPKAAVSGKIRGKKSTETKEEASDGDADSDTE